MQRDEDEIVVKYISHVCLPRHWFSVWRRSVTTDGHQQMIMLTFLVHLRTPGKSKTSLHQIQVGTTQARFDRRSICSSAFLQNHTQHGCVCACAGFVVVVGVVVGIGVHALVCVGERGTVCGRCWGRQLCTSCYRNCCKDQALL